MRTQVQLELTNPHQYRGWKKDRSSIHNKQTEVACATFELTIHQSDKRVPMRLQTNSRVCTAAESRADRPAVSLPI
ncbi:MULTISPECIES: hypothetical protein [unclassified Microcoleus]|uniref:hypothetical protein n=1 Tax=unclassified Microcoleus TaxID=2642155 RepID=UPI002FCEE38E